MTCFSHKRRKRDITKWRAFPLLARHTVLVGQRANEPQLNSRVGLSKLQSFSLWHTFIKISTHRNTGLGWLLRLFDNVTSSLRVKELSDECTYSEILYEHVMRSDQWWQRKTGDRTWSRKPRRKSVTQQFLHQEKSESEYSLMYNFILEVKRKSFSHMKPRVSIKTLD